MSKTSIEWTQFSWNPIRGVKGLWHCTHVSEGCRNCYAERMNVRIGGPAYEPGADTFRLDEKVLQQPLKWRHPRRVFVCSMTDLFHEDVPEEFIDQVFAVMGVKWGHTFQVLTKRPARMKSYLDNIRRQERWWDAMPGRDSWEKRDRQDELTEQFPLPNVWLGVSVEDEKTACERIPILLQTPGAVRWISAEPLLTGIDFSRWLPIAARGNGYEQVKSTAAYGEQKR